MVFWPRFLDASIFEHPLGKIVCVGRNYADHAKELNNPIPSAPLLFIKPATSAVSLDDTIHAPFERGEVHFETELALLIGEPLSNTTPEQAECAVVGVGLALDLTLRAAQARLKEKGHPWEVAKGFDGACPLSRFIKIDERLDWSALRFGLEVNGEVRQSGHAAEMLFPIPHLLVEMSRNFTLQPGDVVLTGTPSGVGPLPPGAELRFHLGESLKGATRVATH